MLLYVAVCLNNKPVFAHINTMTKSFALQPEWHELLKEPLFFERVLSLQLNAERALLEVFVLKASLERDVLFMTELVLDRAILTPTMLQTLMQEN